MQQQQHHRIVRNTTHTNNNKTALLIFLVTSLLLLLQAEPTLSSTPRKNFLTKFFRRGSAKSKENNKDDNNNKNMGQAVRIVQYDRAENERNAISALSLTDGQDELKWHRLDDGVMGGQSETLHRVSNNNNENNDDSKTTTLSFCGTINTNGGGFASIRAPLPNGLPEGTTAIRLLLRGDGKTYKLLLSDGNRSKFGPSRRSPSWQSDIPTTKDTTESITLPLSGFCPSFSGGGPNRPKPETLPKRLEVREMRQIGVMLSLKRSDGSDNPIETFGTGIFPFSLEILSIQPIVDIDETAASSAAESS